MKFRYWDNAKTKGWDWNWIMSVHNTRRKRGFEFNCMMMSFTVCLSSQKWSKEMRGKSNKGNHGDHKKTEAIPSKEDPRIEREEKGTESRGDTFEGVVWLIDYCSCWGRRTCFAELLVSFTNTTRQYRAWGFDLYRTLLRNQCFLFLLLQKDY